MLLWTGGGSFFWSMFKWFFSASGTTCNGWDKFPTFGLKALEWTWQFDWSATYIGVGGSSSLKYRGCSALLVQFLLPGTERV